MKYDLLIKRGRVIDPATQRDEVMDIGIADGLIAAIEKAISSSDARQTIDATGLLVTPGLIEFHAHALFLNGIGLGAELDQICSSDGVTTLVDAGSSGAATFPVFKELLINVARTRILAFLHISSIGLADLAVGESSYLELHQPERAAEIARAHPEIILGIKVRQQTEAVGEHGLEPLMRAKCAAALAGGLPIMVHVTRPPVMLPQIIESLDANDIVSHIYHRRGYGMLDTHGRVLPEVFEARQKGVWFDVAHGSNHFDFHVARRALEQGFGPDTISSDLTRKNRQGVVKSLPHTLSKFLNLGMGLSDVIAGATSQPARILGREGQLGALQPGAIADIAMFMLREGEFRFEDANGNELKGKWNLEPSHTICEGQLAWQRTE